MAFLIHCKATGEQIKHMITDKPLVLGRGLEADVRVEDDEVSRTHCAIWMEGELFLIKDLHSRNHTFVNEMAVTEVELKPHDRIRIGKSEFVFELEGATKGFTNIFRQVEKEMIDKGKGFGTILREVVKEIPKEAPRETPKPKTK